MKIDTMSVATPLAAHKYNNPWHTNENLTHISVGLYWNWWITVLLVRQSVSVEEGKGEYPREQCTTVGWSLYPRRPRTAEFKGAQWVDSNTGMQYRPICRHIHAQIHSSKQDEESHWNNTVPAGHRRHTYTHSHLSPTLLTALKRVHQIYSCCLHNSSSHLEDKWEVRLVSGF